MALELIINGKPESLAALSPGDSLAAAVAALNLKPDRIAVERNGDIAARSAWAAITLSTDDRLEIVQFVGGGAGETGLISMRGTTIHNMCYRT